MFGDIITYSENDYFVTHRIIKKDGKELITKGDNNNEEDKKINESKILGKVIFSSIIIGKFIRKYLGITFAIFTMIVIFINLFCSFKERKKHEEIQVKDNK